MKDLMYYSLLIEDSNTDRGNPVAGIVAYDPNKPLDAFTRTVRRMIAEDLCLNDDECVSIPTLEIGGHTGEEISFIATVTEDGVPPLGEDEPNEDVEYTHGCYLTHTALYEHDYSDNMKNR